MLRRIILGAATAACAAAVLAPTAGAAGYVAHRDLAYGPDPLNRLEGAPVTATVENGAALEVPLGFYVADPEDVVLKVAPGRDCDWAYFTY